jgi:hypothetical protein
LVELVIILRPSTPSSLILPINGATL